MKNGYTERYRKPGRIYRGNDAVFFGVCGGVAEHFDFSPWAVRILCLLLQFTIAPWLFVAYIVLGFVLKKEPPTRFACGVDEEFWNVYQGSRPEALRKVHRSFSALDKRLQRMESIVTSPKFDLEDEYKKL